MEEIKECRKLAILLYQTRFDLWDVCKYINAVNKYWNYIKYERTSYLKFMSEQTGFTKTQLKKLDKVMNKMIKNNAYPLAKEYAIISNLIVAMDEEEFDKYNPEYYKETENYFDAVAVQILEECQKNDEYEDLMCNGKIMDDKENEAIRRYMDHNGFHIVY